MENTPSGIPHFSAALDIAWPTNALVPGCALCAFTITGFPPASAEAVSPPAVEKASGKLLAAKTTTGPIGTNIRRMSGFGIGLRSGCAVSIEASNQDPSRSKSANIFNWLTVLPRSPIILASGNPVSRQQRSIKSYSIFSISAAISSRNIALDLPSVLLYKVKASVAN
jgi:hypothetical protein